MSAARERVPVATAIWVCHPNFITCNPHRDVGEHLLRFYETGYRTDLRRLDGHAFLECRQCQPSTYMFAVFSTRPDPMVTLYEISRESYQTWEKDASPVTLPTAEMLHLLRDPQGRSYNPHFRPRV